MLGLLRKYQKFFFFVVTFVIIFSFSFFGTFGAYIHREKVSDNEIGKLVDGSPLKEQKFFGLIRFLQHGLEEGGRNSNLLNDSVIHKDILLTGLGEILAGHFFEQIKPELESRWKRVKSYIPYVHPHAPFISVRNVWGQFSPKILVLLDEVQKATVEFSKDQLPLLFKLYQAQADFPPPVLHQMLYYQQQQSQVKPDAGLPSANVSLFGFQSVEDWFGTKFVEEVAKTILNAACISREEGYKVSKEEAQTALFSNVFNALKHYNQGKKPDGEDAQKYLSYQLRTLGLNEQAAVDLWREVMYFRRLFHEVGEAVFLDRLSLDHFKSFAKPSLQICRYQLPKELQFTSFRDMLKFQRYLELVTEGDHLRLPSTFKSSEIVMDDHAELVYKIFEVEIAHATKADAASCVSLKETWDWEKGAENFSKLQTVFPPLAGKNSHSVEERLKALDALDPNTRFQVDQYVRNALVEEHPEKIDRMLLSAVVEKKTLKVGLNKGKTPLSGAHFLALLEMEDPALSHYSADGETYYSLKVLEKGKGWHLFSYAEAIQNEILDKKLDDLLLVAYGKFEFEEPFEEVKDEVGTKVYRDLLNSIESVAKIENINDYALHRFDRHLNQMREIAMKNPEIFEESQKGPWALEMRREQIASDPLNLALSGFSPLDNRQFYQLLERIEGKASNEEISAAKSYLKMEAQQELMRKVLSRI